MNQLELDEVLTNTFSNALRADSPADASAKHDFAWLIGILRNQIRSHYREKYRSEKAIAKARKTAKEILNTDFDVPEKLADLEMSTIHQSDMETFWDAYDECIELLDKVHADLFILRDLEDIPVEELSGIFGLRRSDVLELVYRARMVSVSYTHLTLPTTPYV